MNEGPEERPLSLAAFTERHETHVDWGSNLKAGLAAIVAFALVGWTAQASGLPFLMAPLGATAVLLFGQPTSPLSQPANVMGGYFIGTLAGELAHLGFPGSWLAVAIAVGVTIVAMRALRVTHPPAGAMPLFGLAGVVHSYELFVLTLIDCVFLIAVALLVHRLPPRRRYPL